MSGALDPVTGMSVDIGVVDAAVKTAVLDRVDHYDLSATVPALAGVITTGENLARTFWEWLEGALPPGSLRRVTAGRDGQQRVRVLRRVRSREVTSHGEVRARRWSGSSATC